jgi:transposase-like protein
MLQRGGTLILRHIQHKSKKIMLPIISKHINRKATVYSDNYAVYKKLAGMGYCHHIIENKQSESFKKGRYTNGIEGAWSLVKREMRGSHIHVKRRNLQCYLNEFAYRYNKRNNTNSSYYDLLQIVLS